MDPMSADPQTGNDRGADPGPGERPPQQDPVDRVLAESPDQDYVGTRDLTRWPSAAGRVALDLTLRAARWVAPNGLLAITLAIGLALVTVLTALAAGVYEAVVEADGIAGLDRPALDVAVAVRTPSGNSIVTHYTDLGGPVEMPILAAVVAIALALAWRQWTPIVLTAVTGLGSLLLTVVGKAVVGRSRPPLLDAVPPFETSYSFPSGHSLNAMALAGIIAYLLVRKQHTTWLRATTVTLASAFAVTMGLSRVYLGHHWLTDVLVAWTLALAWLAVVITAHRLFITVRRQRRAAQTLP
jgi:membrane-associated phospholipid phosphatase